MKKQFSAINALGIVGALALVPLAAMAEPAKPLPPMPAPGTIGLVVTSSRYANYESDYGKEECPDGMQPGEAKQYEAMTNLAQHQATVGGNWQTRGPNGETADNNPMAVEDPIPFREFKGTRSFGINLDGTQDGRATAKTCAHGKFISPEGEMVDNQIQRVVGCVQGWRTGGHSAEYMANEYVEKSTNRLLIEISGVDDETNDPSVQIAFYKGLDRLVRAAAGDDKFVPYTLQRIDERFPKYTIHATGKIVDGILLMDPVPDARISTAQITDIADRIMKDMTIRLKLTEYGGEGYMAGFEEIDKWYVTHSKKVVSDVSLYSNAALYRAIRRYADGYPDPVTGQCGYISSQFRLTAVRATIVHRPKQPRVAERQDETRIASAQP